MKRRLAPKLSDHFYETVFKIGMKDGLMSKIDKLVSFDWHRQLILGIIMRII